jgi:PAS domain S-box-containing protein
MQLRELRQLVDSTADASFAVDGTGRVVAWNAGAEEMFGPAAREALGKPCGEFLRGADECGPVCSPNCTVLQAAQERRQMRNFDLLVQTRAGQRWCNVSVMIAEVAGSTEAYSVHIVRPIDMRKRLEMLLRDFIVTGTTVPEEGVRDLMASTRAPARAACLSDRELQVLRLVAQGRTTKEISAQLHISTTTVNNHVQHAMRRLNAHTRLEAVRRAELAGLI